MRLRDGTDTDDPRLDRLIQFDEKSLAYPIRAAGVPTKPRSYTWRLDDPVTDQGNEGACVGFAILNELMARPAPVRLTDEDSANRFARKNYWEIQMRDQWPGGAYPGASPHYEGTSVLAGMKYYRDIGSFREFRWAFGLEDLVYGLGHNGPAVLGINWYDSMYRPVDGWISPRRGTLVGGHAILARGVKITWLNKPLAGTWSGVNQDRSYVLLRNSWGRSWGDNGDAKITLSDLGWLLDRQGEAAFAIHRAAKLKGT